MNLKKRVLVTFFGVLFVFILAEISLAIVGYFSVQNQLAANYRQLANSGLAEKKDVLRILFLGNSHTVGLGVQPEEAYASVLQKFFDQVAPQKVMTFNGGMYAANTSILYDNLDLFLKTTNPHIVVMMAGEPNIWNRSGMSAFLMQSKIKKETDFKSKARDFLFRSRVIRWLHFLPVLLKSNDKLTDDNLDYQAHLALSQLSVHRTGDALPYEVFLQLRQTLDRYIESVRNNPPENWRAILSVQARSYQFTGEIQKTLELVRESVDYKLGLFDLLSFNLLRELIQNPKSPPAIVDEAKAVLHRATLSFPGDTKVKKHEALIDRQGKSISDKEKIKLLEEFSRYAQAMSASSLMLEEIYLRQRQPRLAAEALMRYISIDPLTSSIHIHNLLSIYRDHPEPEVQQSIKDFLDKLTRRFPHEAGRYSLLSESEITDWVAWDLERTIDKLQQHQIKILVQSYHWQSSTAMTTIFSAQTKAAKKKNVPFLHTGLLFEKFIEKDGGNSKSFYLQTFGPNDNHPSVKGHRAIARAIYESLVANHLLPTELESFDPNLIFPD